MSKSSMSHERRKYFWQLYTKTNQMNCFYCSKELKIYPFEMSWYIPDKLTLDHLWPRCLGGDHSEGNIVPACLNCNGKKAAKTYDELTGILSYGIA